MSTVTCVPSNEKPSIWGDVVFYMYTEFDNKHKRVTLSRVHCAYDKRFEVVSNFKRENDYIIPAHIHAHFVMSEYLE